MKKIISVILVLAVLLNFAIVFVSAAPSLPTKEFEGKTYYCVNTKAQYKQLVDYAVNNLLEEVLIYREPDKTEYDSSWSNDVRNFCDYKSYRELKYLDYNTNTVSGYADQKAVFDDLNCFVGMTPEAYGKLEIEYNDSKEEIKQAEALIRNNVLSKLSGKSEVEKIEFIVNYVCSVVDSGSTRLPDGGYDLINGVYDVLSGHHTNVVCTSFTVTLQKIFEMAGINSVMIHNVAHIWNMVCVDGTWYGIDATAGDTGKTMSKDSLLMGFDRLKGFDNGEHTPIATFKASHKLADKSYYAQGNTTGTPTDSGNKPSGNASSSKPASDKNTSSAASTESNSTVSSEDENSSSEPVSSENNTATEKPQANKVTVDLTQGLVVSAEVFKNAKEKGEELSLVGDGYTWKFASNSISDTDAATEFNAEVFVGEAVSEQAKKAIETATEISADEVYPFSFSHHGKLPGEAEITISVDKPELKGKTVYIYYLNDKNEPVRAGQGVISEDNTLTFTTDHCSVWFLSQEKLEKGSPVTLILIIAGAAVLIAGAGVGIFFFLKRKSAVQSVDETNE